MSLLKLVKNNLHCVTKWEREMIELPAMPSYRKTAISKGLHSKIELVREALIDPDEEADIVNEAEDFVDRMETLFAQLNESAIPSLESSSSSVRLPKLDLEPFHGDLYSFDQFWSLFCTCVDENKCLSKAEKLSYLVSLLKGEAQSVVSGMLITPKNYELAKTQLISRYGHKKRLTHSLFRRLLALEQCSADPSGLRIFHNSLVTCVRSLENQEINLDQHSELLCPHILEKLPHDLKIKCITAFEGGQWLISSLLRTLELQVNQIEACDFSEMPLTLPFESQLSSTFSSLPASTQSRYDSLKSSSPKCIFCDKSNHASRDCKKISTFSARFGIVKRKHLCLICFSPNHTRKDCTSSITCSNCKGAHHAALCKSFLSTPASNVSATTVSTSRRGTVLLQQIRGKVCDQEGKYQCYVNILFDTGSHLTYIREGVAEKLNLSPTSSVNLKISTFMSNQAQEVQRSRVSLKLCGDNKSLNVSAIVVPKICTLTPVKMEIPHCLNNLDFSQFERSCNEAEVDILIGMDLYWMLVTNEVVQSGDGYFAVNTMFGWTLSGCPTKSLPSSANTASLLISGNDETATEEKIEQMFSHDFSFLGGSLSDNEEACFLERVRFDPDNQRYVASLPWKGNKKSLSDHRFISKKRLMNLHKKLALQPDLLDKYNEQLMEQLSEGIIEGVDEEQHTSTLKHYMPHHGVIKMDNTSTKLRIVFDGAVKSRQKDLALNNCLLVGPKLIQLMLPLIIKFRCHEIGFVADITKAFLMIEVDQEDRDSLRFLWFRNHNNPSEGTVCFRFVRLPFGLVCSPAILNSILKHHLESNGNSCYADFYVDDLISGCTDAIEGQEKYKNVTSILSKAGFELHKFASNNPELNAKFNQSCDVSVVKVLGLKWITHADQLVLNVSNLSLPDSSMTKRSLLKMLGHIFDPLGLLSPITLGIRLVFQTTWQLKLPWDEVLPSDLIKLVKTLSSTLFFQSNLSIPRFLCGENETTISIVGFCDASAKAIACVLYMVRTDSNHQRSVAYVCGKSRVRPYSKSFTIPRLELLSCLLLSNLYVSIRDSFPCHNNMFFSDSVCALSWIKNESKTWKQFVQSRVDVIRSAISLDSWYYVPGDVNPADVGTRGECDPTTFQFWIHGPDFLLNGSIPCQPEHFFTSSDKEEVIVNTAADTETFFNPLPTLDIGRFGSFKKLLNTVARILAFFRRKSRFQDFSEEAELLICQSVQYQFLLHIYQDINSKRRLQISKQLKLFISSGLIFVDTRVPNCVVAGKPLILLPYKCDFTVLLIRYCHEQVMHAGLAVTLAKVRETFWVITGRQAVKNVISRCTFCNRVRGKSYQYPDPPKLPEFRVQGSPFGTVGVDYTGPFKTLPGSYILLFTCSVSRAIHLELTPDLTTNQFILALQRFVARRGAPTAFVSDNAKTFVSASITLESIRSTTSTCTFLVDNKIRWLFNCSRASWWGGWFERMIGLVKDILRKILPKRKMFTFIEFNTLICNVERVINSRPLTYLSSTDSYKPITPAHLIGSKDCFDLKDLDIMDIYLKRHELVRKMWLAFLRVYLVALNERNTHRSRVSTTSPPNIGDVCLFHEPGLKLWHWPLGRIEELPRSKDGVVRKAMVRTYKGTLVERAIQHLVPLEAHDTA